MINERIKALAEGEGVAFVASSDESGVPHLAAFTGLEVPDPQHIVFSEWFCPRTLENVAANPAVAVAVMDPASGTGYQFVGRVENISSMGIMVGYQDEPAVPKTPQVLYELRVRVDAVLEFTHRVHTDRPL